MGKIIKIESEEIVIGNDDGTMIKVKPSDLNFSPHINDEVTIFKNDSDVVVTKVEQEKDKIQTNKTNKTEYGGVISWIFGILLIITGVTYIPTIFLAGIIWIAAGAILLPPVTKWIFDVTNFKITWWMKIIFFFVIEIICGYIITDSPFAIKENAIKENAQKLSDKSTAWETSGIGWDEISSTNINDDEIYNIGEEFETDKFAITITKVETRSQVGSTYFSTKPADGAVYVCVQYKCKNISDKPISAFSLPTFNLVDSNRVKYDSDISGSTYYATEVTDTSKVLSDLNPMLSINGSTVFEVAKELYDTKDWTIELTSRPYSKVKINK